MPIPLGIFIYVQSTEVLLLNRVENIEPPIGTASVTMRLPGVPPPNFEEWEGNAEFAIHHDPGMDLPIASATPNPPGLPPILEEWGGEYQYVYENVGSNLTYDFPPSISDKSAISQDLYGRANFSRFKPQSSVSAQTKPAELTFRRDSRGWA